MNDYDIESIEKAKKIIDADISRHFTITDIAEKSALGKTKLKQGFKQYYGMGLYTYLRRARMTKAMELVSGTSKTFKEIAKITGFRHYNNFISTFGLYHGLTPGQARKKTSPN